MDQHADVWQVLGDLLWNKGLDTKQKLLRLSESTQNRVWFNKKIFCCARALNQHILVLEMNKTITNNKQIPNHNQQQKMACPLEIVEIPCIAKNAFCQNAGQHAPRNTWLFVARLEDLKLRALKICWDVLRRLKLVEPHGQRRWMRTLVPPRVFRWCDVTGTLW